MIVLNLMCEYDHCFDGWFASVKSFDIQLAAKLVACPTCNSLAIRRLPSSPHIIHAANREAGTASSLESPARVQQLLMEAVSAVIASAEDVGDEFPDEARRIHRKEVPTRQIRGVASVRDTVDLLEEGIPVVPLPALPTKH
jgi:hypothetical protein